MLGLLLELFYHSMFIVPLTFSEFIGGIVAFSFVAFAFIVIRRFFHV